MDYYGIESRGDHGHAPHRKPTRYLVLIETTGIVIARMMLEDRTQVAEFDASTEEVALMTQGLKPVKCAHLPEWDQALASHTLEERRAADVYTLDI